MNSKNFKIVQASWPFHDLFSVRSIYNIPSSYHEGTRSSCEAAVRILESVHSVLTHINLTYYNLHAVQDLIVAALNFQDVFSTDLVRTYVRSYLTTPPPKEQPIGSFEFGANLRTEATPVQGAIVNGLHYIVLVSETPEMGAFKVVRSKDGMVVFYGTANEALDIMAAMNNAIKCETPRNQSAIVTQKASKDKPAVKEPSYQLAYVYEKDHNTYSVIREDVTGLTLMLKGTKQQCQAFIDSKTPKVVECKPLANPLSMNYIRQLVEVLYGSVDTQHLHDPDVLLKSLFSASMMRGGPLLSSGKPKSKKAK